MRPAARLLLFLAPALALAACGQPPPDAAKAEPAKVEAGKGEGKGEAGKGESGKGEGKGEGKAEASAPPKQGIEDASALIREGERHFAKLEQLTFGGENAEAYLSFDERRLVFQSTREGRECDQIYTLDLATGATALASTGKGRTTCAYFLPGDERILYASTHAAGDGCLPPPDRSHGYVWKLYDEFDIYTAKADGSDPKLLVSGPGYDAEATVSPKGDRIVFTSTRDGDPELYSIAIDGSDLKRLTSTPGYDGGAFFSPDGARLVYRANHPEGEEELAKYREIQKEGLVRPTRLEIFVMNADGSEPRQVTRNGKANFAPFFLPDGKRIIFSSNQDDPIGRGFDLYLIGDDGQGVEKVTTEPSFDGFPMFSRDGKTLIFASNRGGKARGETNVFRATWQE